MGVGIYGRKYILLVVNVYVYVGLLFLLFLIYQHVGGALSWYK
jgi:hypothetical protein